MTTILFEPSGTVEAFRDTLKSLHAQGCRSVMALACEGNGFQPAQMDPLLRESPLSLFGGIFPLIVHDARQYARGTVFVGFDAAMPVNIVTGMSTLGVEEIDVQMERQSRAFNERVRTVFVFVDGLSRGVGRGIDLLYDNYGLGVNYIGGGTGSLSFEAKPTLLSSEGMLEDAMLYAFCPLESRIGVEHGWRRVQGPFQVTRSTGTVLHELDHRPAFEVYKEAVERVSAFRFAAENFFDVSKHFPFGISKISGESVVRDPIKTSGGDIVCVGELDEGCYVDILSARKEELVRAAERASQESCPGQSGFELTLFIDCISRVLFLEEAFEEELAVLNRCERPVVGALTLGEIANSGRNYLEFYNKTVVVGRIGCG